MSNVLMYVFDVLAQIIHTLFIVIHRTNGHEPKERELLAPQISNKGQSKGEEGIHLETGDTGSKGDPALPENDKPLHSPTGISLVCTRVERVERHTPEYI